jgi:hypothetical protein
MKEEETMEKKKTKEFLLFFNWRGILMYIPKYIEREKNVHLQVWKIVSCLLEDLIFEPPKRYYTAASSMAYRAYAFSQRYLNL